MRPPHVPKPELALNGLRIAMMHAVLGVRGHPAVNQTGQVECGPAAPLVAFPDTSLSHDDRALTAVSATLSSQWLVGGFNGCACGEPVPSPCPQSPDKLNFTSSSLIKPFVSKIVTQPLGELNWTPPSLHPPAESNAENS